jgi:hypothetical protein
LIGFISPQFDPEESDLDAGLPTRENEGNNHNNNNNITTTATVTNYTTSEFRPFARRLPEFKFWYSCIKAVGKIHHHIYTKYYVYHDILQNNDHYLNFLHGNLYIIVLIYNLYLTYTTLLNW